MMKQKPHILYSLFAFALEYLLISILIKEVLADWDSWWTYEGISGQKQNQ